MSGCILNVRYNRSIECYNSSSSIALPILIIIQLLYTSHSLIIFEEHLLKNPSNLLFLYKNTNPCSFQTLGLHGAFWFYAAVAVCGLCFVVCCVPETKGKQLDEMNPDYAQAR